MINPCVIVSLLSVVFNSFRNLVCSKSVLDEELLRLGKAELFPDTRSPPNEDVDADTPAFATEDNVPADAMSVKCRYWISYYFR